MEKKNFPKQSKPKYSEQSKEIKQNRAGPDNFQICFCVIVEHFCQSFTFERENEH